MTLAAGTPIVISTGAKRSGEISPSDGTGGNTAGDLQAQSFIKAFSICPIPTCSSARDDGVGEQHPVISEGDEPHLRHFDRSEAKWRNLTPLMTKCHPAPPSFRPMKTCKKAVKKWFTFFTAFFRGLPMTSPGFQSFLSVHCRQSSSIGSRNSLLLMKDSLQA